MSLPFFTSAKPRAANDGGGSHQWKQASVALIALMGITAIAAAGGALSHFMGPPRAFILIVTAVAIWSIAGWFLGGWRAAIAGLAALTSALAMAYGQYISALVCAGISFLFLFLDISATGEKRNAKSLE